MDIFSKLRQDQLVSRFNTELEMANMRLVKELAVNKTSRQKNLADFVSVSEKLNTIISSFTFLHDSGTPSFALDFSKEQISQRTKNKSAVEFSVMMYVKEGYRISPEEADGIYAQLGELCDIVDISGRMSKCYLTLVFDKHDYEDPKPLQADTYAAVTAYYDRVLKPTEGEQPLGKADINQAWNEAIAWYIEQQKIKF